MKKIIGWILMTPLLFVITYGVISEFLDFISGIIKSMSMESIVFVLILYVLFIVGVVLTSKE